MIKTYSSLNDLGEIIEQEKAKKIFLVTSKKSYENSRAKKIIEAALSGLSYCRYFDFDVNPKIDDLVKGVNLVAEFMPDLMLAIGGGSVLDTAKLISVLYDDRSSIQNTIKGKKQVKNRNYPLIAIPTTAGSGSECTHFAVAYMRNEKYSVASPSILPEYNILDPTLTYSMLPNLTAVSGMDALSQAIEAFWAVNATEESCVYAKEALEKILDAFPDVVISPTFDARNKMFMGAHLAGKAINISKTTAPHALSYSLTMNYDIPHGYAVFLTLPSFYMINSAATVRNLNKGLKRKTYKNRIKILHDSFANKGHRNIFEYLNNIILKTGNKLRLRELGIKKNDLTQIAESVNLERLKNNPVALDNREILSLLNSIW